MLPAQLFLPPKKVNLWLLDTPQNRSQRTWYEEVILQGCESGWIKAIKMGDEPKTYWIRESLISEIQVL